MASLCVRWNLEFDGKDDQLFLQQRVHDFLQGGQVTSDVACGSFEAQHNSGVQHMRETYMSSFCSDKTASRIASEECCANEHGNPTGTNECNGLAIDSAEFLAVCNGISQVYKQIHIKEHATLCNLISSSSSLVALQALSLRVRGAGDDDEHKTKKPQWNEERGSSWERFKREARVYLTGYYVTANDDYSLWNAVTGLDMGGDAVGAPVMLAAGAPGAQAQNRYRTKRQAKAWAECCDFLDEGSDIRKLLMSLNEGDQPPPGGGGGNQGIGRRAWLLMETHGQQRFDDEYIIEVIDKFNHATILATVQERPSTPCILRDGCTTCEICIFARNS